jgi:DNA-binding LacI/PurR family transcriptional regulator
VLIGVPAEAEHLTCVDLDFTAAGRLAVDHLADLGHDRIVLVGPDARAYRRGSGNATRMLRGVRQQAARRGVGFSHHTSDGSPAGSAELVDQLLGDGSGVTGVIVKNEKAMVPLLDALRDASVRVPDDVALVTVAPDAIAERTSPSLSSIDLPFEQMAERAVELLMDKLGGADWTGVTLFPPRLTARASSGAARVLG